MKKEFSFIFWLLIPISLLGQLPNVTSQYTLNPIAINPALAGSNDALSAILLYKNQWVGFEGAPKTLTFSAHSPMRNQNMGLGISIVNNQIGVTDETSIIGNYSFKINMREGSISMGLGVGFVMLNTAWSELKAHDENDLLLQNNSPTYLIPEVSLGAFYSSKTYYIGFSIPYMLSYTFNASKDKYNVKNNIKEYNYILTGEYIFDLRQDFTLVPRLLLKYHRKEKTDVIFSNSLVYMDKYSIGVAYDSEQDVYRGMLQVMINEQFRIGYATDFSSHKLNQYRIGSHEFMLQYNFKYTIRVKSPRSL